MSFERVLFEFARPRAESQPIERLQDALISLHLLELGGRRQIYCHRRGRWWLLLGGRHWAAKKKRRREDQDLAGLWQKTPHLQKRTLAMATSC